MKPKQREAYVQAVGARVTKYRKRKGLSQEDLAEAIGVSRSAMSRIEKGQQELTISRTQELAFALGVAASNIMSLTGKEGLR